MESESSLVLPWHWVIEALAGFKEITLPTLQALIDASLLTHHDFSETTKDLIALKCLEELYPSSSSSTTTLEELDYSLSSQDVLLQILHQVSLSNLRTSGPELFKWDFNRFIAHKRADNVKCQLEKLKESILDGTLPLNDHLKERSGLFQTNRAHTGKCYGYSTYAQDSGEKENSVSLISEDNNCLSSKRNRVYSANEHEPDLHLKGSNLSQKTVSSDKSQDDTSVYQCENLNLVIKRRKKDSHDKKFNKGSQLLVSEATSVPLLVPESCIGMLTNIYPRHPSGVEPCRNKLIDEANDTVHVEPIPTNDDGNADKVQHMTNESQPKQKEPNVASFKGSQKPAASDKAVVDTVNDCGAELSSDSDVYYNEKIDLTAIKDEFLSSQHASGQDLPAMTESRGQNLCSKCNEAGQLLVCTTCPLMLHKNCLGDSAQLDAKGNFLCPFCKYSHAISEYLEAKKISSSARKELAIFNSKGSIEN